MLKSFYRTVVYYVTITVTFSILQFLFVSFFSSNILWAYPDGWSDDIMVSEDTSRIQTKPDIDVDSQNNVWISWDVASLFEGEIYYTKRDSMGSCIIAETNVSNNASKSFYAQIAVDCSDNIHFIWRDETPLGYGIWHAKLSNDGSTIVASHLAVSGAGGLFSSLRSEMVLDKYQNVNVVWDERLLSYNQINYTKLDSLGNPIISKIRVSPEGLESSWPGIGVDSFASNHMAYRTDTTGNTHRLTYSKIDVNGNIVVLNKILGGMGAVPVIIADQSQNIHMVYTDPSGPGMSIKYMKLDQDGNVLIPSKILSIYEGNNYPHMAMDSLQFLHVVWDSESLDVYPIMYAKIDTLGEFVIPPMQIVYPPHSVRGGGGARIAVDYNNHLHVLWVDDRLNPGETTDVFYKRGENIVGKTEDDERGNITKSFHVFPNPFHRAVNVNLPALEEGRLEIFDVTGRLVKTIKINKNMKTVTWAGNDDRGRQLSSGVYFLHLVKNTRTIHMPSPIILVR